MPWMEETLAVLTRLLRQARTGRYAIAIAGAHAKGMADAKSDIDLFLYLETPKPEEERRRLVEALADPGTSMWITPDFHDGAWGGSMDFSYRGTPVETTAKLLPEFDREFSRALCGEFDIIPADWTSNGYFTYICLSEIQFVKPIDDPYGILAEYKKQTAAYPEPLRRAICERFLSRSSFWLDSFHYDSAVSRGDFLFTGPIVQHMVLDFIQVTFALNRVYFTGDKKLAKQLSALPYCPAEFLEQLSFLTSAPGEPSLLERQRTILRRTKAELEEKCRSC